MKAAGPEISEPTHPLTLLIIACYYIGRFFHLLESPAVYWSLTEIQNGKWPALIMISTRSVLMQVGPGSVILTSIYDLSFASLAAGSNVLGISKLLMPS